MDDINERPRTIEWTPCPCGHRACTLQYPSNIGSFNQGSGFARHEVRWLNAAWQALNDAEEHA